MQAVAAAAVRGLDVELARDHAPDGQRALLVRMRELSKEFNRLQRELQNDLLYKHAKRARAVL